MKSVEWWRGASTHMWRQYFAVERDMKEGKCAWEDLPMVKQRIYALCNHVYMHRFVSADQAILRMYFTTRWGDDQYAVEDYSLKQNIPTRVIWIVIRRANRIIMEEVGLLEKKESDADE